MPRTTEASRAQARERAWLMVSRHPDGVSESELSAFTGIHRRTLNNYLNELADEGRIAKEGTLWFPLPYAETRLRALTLTPEEAYSLYLGCRLLVKQQDKHNEPAQAALLKLAEALTDDAQVGQEIAQAAAELAQRPAAPAQRSIFETVVRGCIYRRRVKLRYQPLRGRSFTTSFAPYLLEPSAIGHATYVIGHSSAPDALRAYKLERIQEAELTRERFRVPADFPGLAILRDAWSIMMGDSIMGDRVVEVALRFSPAVRARVLETHWHPSQQVVDDPERPGHLRWTVRIADTTDMLPWIRSWGPDVEVLAPAPLRETLLGQARALAQAYGWQVTPARPRTNTPSSALDIFFGDE